MGISDIFGAFRAGSGPQQQPGQQGQGDPTLNPTVPSSATPASDGKNAPAAFPAVQEGEKSPLENFQKLWDKADTDAKPIDPAVSFNADPVKVMAAAKQIDITKGIDPALLARVNAGNDSAALVELVNQSVQIGIAHATTSTTGIVNEALKQQSAKYEKEVIPEILRRNNIQNTNRAADPLFQNPAVAPMLAMAEQQLMIKYPTASAAEISEKAKEYIGGFAGAVAESRGMEMRDKPKAATSGSGGISDWTEWAQKG